MNLTIEQIYDKLPQGWLDKDELTLMLAYAIMTTGDILEVGCYRGRSTVGLAMLDRQVYTVDPFSNFDSDDVSGDGIYEDFLENTAKYKNIKLYKQRIEDWEVLPVGFAFLDGDHTYQGTLNQIDKALLCRPEWIAMHDINNSGQGLEISKAAEERLGLFIIRSGKMAIFKPHYEN